MILDLFKFYFGTHYVAHYALITLFYLIISNLKKVGKEVKEVKEIDY